MTNCYGNVPVRLLIHIAYSSVTKSYSCSTCEIYSGEEDSSLRWWRVHHDSYTNVTLVAKM